MSKENIKRNWEISRENAATASWLGRSIILFLSVLMFFGQLPWRSEILLYMSVDLAQYIASTLMYFLVTNLQELKVIDVFPRPRWINCPGYILYYLKFGILYHLLYVIIA